MTLSPLGHSIGHKHGEHLDKLYSINTFDTFKTFILFLGKKKTKTKTLKLAVEYWLKVFRCYFHILCVEKSDLND